jgi:hypothetical protein
MIKDRKLCSERMLTIYYAQILFCNILKKFTYYHTFMKESYLMAGSISLALLCFLSTTLSHVSAMQEYGHVKQEEIQPNHRKSVLTETDLQRDLWRINVVGGEQCCLEDAILFYQWAVGKNMYPEQGTDSIPSTPNFIYYEPNISPEENGLLEGYEPSEKQTIVQLKGFLRKQKAYNSVLHPHTVVYDVEKDKESLDLEGDFKALFREVKKSGLHAYLQSLSLKTIHYLDGMLSVGLIYAFYADKGPSDIDSHYFNFYIYEDVRRGMPKSTLIVCAQTNQIWRINDFLNSDTAKMYDEDRFFVWSCTQPRPKLRIVQRTNVKNELTYNGNRLHSESTKNDDKSSHILVRLTSNKPMASIIDQPVENHGGDNLKVMPGKRKVSEISGQIVSSTPKKTTPQALSTNKFNSNKEYAKNYNAISSMTTDPSARQTKVIIESSSPRIRNFNTILNGPNERTAQAPTQFLPNQSANLTTETSKVNIESALPKNSNSNNKPSFRMVRQVQAPTQFLPNQSANFTPETSKVNIESLLPSNNNLNNIPSFQMGRQAQAPTNLPKSNTVSQQSESRALTKKIAKADEAKNAKTKERGKIGMLKRKGIFGTFLAEIDKQEKMGYYGIKNDIINSISINDLKAEFGEARLAYTFSKNCKNGVRELEIFGENLFHLHTKNYIWELFLDDLKDKVDETTYTRIEAKNPLIFNKVGMELNDPILQELIPYRTIAGDYKVHVDGSCKRVVLEDQILQSFLKVKWALRNQDLLKKGDGTDLMINNNFNGFNNNSYMLNTQPNSY